MATATSETRNWRTLATLTLERQAKKVWDNVTQGSAFFDLLKRREDGYVAIDSLGERARMPVSHTLPAMQVFDGADELRTTQPDTHTNAFYDWREAAVPVTVTGKERNQNKGEHQIMNLVRERFNLANSAASESFNKYLLRGDVENSDANSLVTPFTDTGTGRVFIDPLFKIVAKAPSTGVVGAIDPAGSGNSFWQNLILDGGGASWAAFDKNIDFQHMRCSRGPHGPPDVHICDENVLVYYKLIRRQVYRETNFRRIDIPWENIAFHGAPLVADQFMPNVEDNDSVVEAAKGTWVMLNTKTFQIQYLASENFSVDGPIRPPRQKATIWYLMWSGALVCGNRRKNNVIFNIDTTVTS